MKSGIDLPNEVQGLVPSPEWKQAARSSEKWYAGETISVSIGQGAVSVTPVSMAVYVATLANGGTRVTPHLLKAVDDGSGWKPVPAPPPQSKVAIDPEKLQAIRDGLWMVVNGAGTGGTRRSLKGYDISGKTGTAQVISNQGKARAGKTEKDLRDNGWFVFFAPRDNPEIAGVVFARARRPRRRTPRSSRITCSTRSSPRRKGGRCRRSPNSKPTSCPDGHEDVRSQTLEVRSTATRKARSPTCSNAASTTTSTGRC